MRSIALMSQKGGVGKTTLCVHIAVAAAQAGLRTTLVDLDQQRSASDWHATRGKSTPTLSTVNASQLHGVITSLRYDVNNLVVVDCPPHAGPDAAIVARSVDLVLIPVRPSALDVRAVYRTVEIVRKAGARAAFVLSACPDRAPEIAETRMVLGEFEYPIVHSIVSERRSFSRSVAIGQTAMEFEPLGKAATEIAVLWRWLTHNSERSEEVQ